MNAEDEAGCAIKPRIVIKATTSQALLACTEPGRSCKADPPTLLETWTWSFPSCDSLFRDPSIITGDFHKILALLISFAQKAGPECQTDFHGSDHRQAEAGKDLGGCCSISLLRTTYALTSLSILDRRLGWENILSSLILKPCTLQPAVSWHLLFQKPISRRISPRNKQYWVWR